MPSSGMWRCVDLVRTDVLGELVASIFRVKKSASKRLTVFFARFSLFATLLLLLVKFSLCLIKHHNMKTCKGVVLGRMSSRTIPGTHFC
jgi:hypothetical protein